VVCDAAAVGVDDVLAAARSGMRRLTAHEAAAAAEQGALLVDTRTATQRRRQGFSSGLAAASLRHVGLYRATDVIGGVEAWIAAGLSMTCGPADVRE
jgi:rhodanese-related sulfurtransferase